MIMNSKQKKIKIEPRMKLNFNIYIDEHLSWSTQVDHIVMTISEGLASLSQEKNFNQNLQIVVSSII